MRSLVILVALAGCGKKDASPPERTAPQPQPAAPTTAIDLPRGRGAFAPKPAVYVFVSAAGTYETGSTLDGPRAAAADLEAVDTAILKLAVNTPFAEAARDRMGELVRLGVALAIDDPPPPPDDGAGTGVAVPLDEGKMRKKDYDRVEGQYKMKKASEDPEVARREAIAQARASGILAADELPQRGELAGARGSRVAEMPPYAPVVVASAKAPAIAVARVLADLGGVIAVAGDPASVVDVAFHGRGGDHGSGELPWLEVTRSSGKLAIVNAKDLAVRPTEKAELVALAHELGTADERIDILASDFTTQELVDVIIALHEAGWQHLAVIADEADAGQRAAKLKIALGPYVSIGQPNLNGDLDKAIIRRYIRRVEAQLLTCYTDPLVKDPNLQGTVSAQFYIGADGLVTMANASGVSGDVSTCVANAIKAIEFPRPKGGGGVQVNYPFTYYRGR